MTLAAVDLSNLLYLAGALVAATIVSAVYLLRHRRPRSMEAGINEFSRELRALAPDAEGRRQNIATSTPTEPRQPPAGEKEAAASTSSNASAGKGGRARSTRARTSARDTGDGQTG